MVTLCNKCGTEFGGTVIPDWVPDALPGFVVGLFIGFLLTLVHPMWILFAAPLCFVSMWMFSKVPQWTILVRNRFRPCPNCGERDWT